MDITQIRRENLQELVDSLAGGNKTKFAAMCGIDSPAYLGQLLMSPEKKSSRNIGHKTARSIEKSIGLDHGVLDQPLGVSESRVGYAINIDMDLDQKEIDPRVLGKVPLISSIQAGDPEMAIDNFAPGDAEDWLYCNTRHSRLTYALRVEGESMTSQFGKSYPNGCIIFVDPEQRGHVTPGDHIIAKINGLDKVMFKAFARDGDRAFLKPLNPQYPTIMDEFRVLGLVIGKWED